MSEAERNALAMVEYDWIYTVNVGRRLHHPAQIDDLAAWWNEAPRGMATATCGLRTEFGLPGVLSRLGMSRCARCCDRLGIPRGVGSPKNDDSLRPWVRARLEDASNGE